MIEIIKRGKPPGEIGYEVTCHNCKSELRFKGSDAKYSNDQRDGNYLSIDCPVCHRKVTSQVRR